jgi:hypothetical protein
VEGNTKLPWSALKDNFPFKVIDPVIAFDPDNKAKAEESNPSNKFALLAVIARLEVAA